MNTLIENVSNYNKAVNGDVFKSSTIDGEYKKRLKLPNGMNWIGAEPEVYIDEFGATTFVDTETTADITYYVKYNGGNDSNDGLTPETPKKILQILMSALNASPPVGLVEINLIDDALPNVYFALGSSSNFSVRIKSEYNHRLCDSDGNTYNTLHAGDTYYGSRVKTMSHIVDFTNLDEYGVPIRLDEVASLAECESTPNTFYNPSDLYIHTFDGRQPDTDILTYAGNVHTSLNENVFELDGIDYYGYKIVSTGEFKFKNSTIGAIYWGIDDNTLHASIDNCKFTGTITDETIVNGGSSTNGGNLVILNSLANGIWVDNGGSMNCFTAHGIANTFIANCKFIGNEFISRVVHPSIASHTYIYGCITERGSYTDVLYNNPAYAVGGNGATAKMWIERCIATGDQDGPDFMSWVSDDSNCELIFLGGSAPSGNLKGLSRMSVR